MHKLLLRDPAVGPPALETIVEELEDMILHQAPPPQPKPELAALLAGVSRSEARSGCAL